MLVVSLEMVREDCQVQSIPYGLAHHIGGLRIADADDLP